MMDKSKASIGMIMGAIMLIVIGSATYIIVTAVLKPSVNVQLGDGIFRAQVINYDEQIAGSSVYEVSASDINTKVLGANAGFKSIGQAVMVVLPTEAKWKVSLKNVSTSIDVVWLNSNKKVVYIVKNVTPEEIIKETYEPKNSAEYVIQFMAGTVDNKMIRIGDMASFNINNTGKK